MIYVLYIGLALLASSSSVLARRPLKLLDLGYRTSRPSSAEIAEIISQLKRVRSDPIDMDYFGESVERSHPLQRTSAEMPEKERNLNPFTHRPIVMYLSQSKVPNKYKKESRMEGGSTEDLISNADVMQFLVELDARLKQQEGRPLNRDYHENMKLINFLRTFRKSNNDEENDDLEEKPVKSKKVRKERKPKKREKNRHKSREVADKSSDEKFESKEKNHNSKDSSYKAKGERIYQSSGEMGYISIEPAYKPRKERGSKPRNLAKERVRFAPKSDRLFNFIRTPKPWIGKKGIYEEN